MSSSGDGYKPAQTGLVDMGNISFYGNTANPIPTFNIAELAPYQGSFSEVVLNVTWAQMQAAEGGPLTTSAIDSAISQVNSYNAANGTDLGLKLRVWGGFTAPDWAKNIDGAPITVSGQSTVDPRVFTDQTIGRFWTADYIDAWTSFQNALGTRYDSNPVIRGISQTAGAAASDEPFVPLKTAAALSTGGTVNQVAELQAGGYNDVAEMLTLRASIADYSQWSTTPLDFTMNSFYVFNSGQELNDATFALAILQQAHNSTRLVQAGNHALRNPLYSADLVVYAQLAADAALNPAVAPNSFQTASPIVFFPTYADWQAAVDNGVGLDAGNIELWDFPGTSGFTGLSASQVQGLAAVLAAGSPPPNAGAPDNGSALGIIAPAFATGAAGRVAFTGVDALLLASTTVLGSYSVTLTSMNGGTLSVTSLGSIVSGPTSGPTLTMSGPIGQVNTVLASLTDTLQSGSDIVQITATDGSGHKVVRNVGVEVSPSAVSSGSATGASSGSDTGGGPSGSPAASLTTSGETLAFGGVQSSFTIAGNFDIGGASTMLAALAPSAYSTASLTVGGTLEVQNGGSAYFTGSLGAGAVVIDSGGEISGAGTVTASVGPIVNNGTIEAMADRTLGLQQLTLADDVSGNGMLVIDPGATLIMSGNVGPGQTIKFNPNSITQFSNNPYSPSTLMLQHAQPGAWQGTITGFSFADRLVLDGVTANGASYNSATGTLTITAQDGGPLSITLSGNLAGLSPVISSGNTITFVAPPAELLPRVVAPATLQGSAQVAVLVPDIVLETPLPASAPSNTTVTVTLSAATGALSANNDNGNTAITGNGLKSLKLVGSLDAVERSLQTLAYTATAGASTDTITIGVTDYAGTSAQELIRVFNSSSSAPPPRFDWVAAGGSFGDPGNWTVNGASGSTPPGGQSIASFGPGTHIVTGDGAVGLILAAGTTTLTGQVTAQGSGGVALVVDGDATLILAGGAVLTAQQQATVGATGQGELVLMGGALALTGTAPSNALVIGANAGSYGSVVNLEQITVAGNVFVGAAGTGLLQLLGGASTVADGGAFIGLSAGAQGTAIVNGGLWQTSGQLTVGNAGAGWLLIDGMHNGITGQVTAFNATIGAQAGGQGSVTLEGGNLLIADAAALSSTLTVGQGGFGSLTIDNASDVSVGAALAVIANSGTFIANNGMLEVGGTAGGSGLIHISGSSTLLVSGDATVGGTNGAGDIFVGGSAVDTALFATAGTLAINNTGEITLGGANATLRASAIDILSSGVLSGSGTVSGLGGGNNTVTLARIDNDGLIAANGGTLLLYGGITGTGMLSVASGATLTLQAAISNSQTLAFGPNAQVMLNDASAFAGLITGFGSGDVLDVAGTNVTGATWSNGVLTLDTAVGALQLKLAGSYAANGFSVRADGHGGTDVLLAGGQPLSNVAILGTLIDASHAAHAD